VREPLFISFFTGDPYYKECAISLERDLSQLGIESEIEEKNNLGFYWKNTLQKPEFILNKVMKHQRDLVWIDVDTRIFSYPDKLKSWNSNIILASHTGTLEGIKASPIGIKYNQSSISFLEKWTQVSNERIAKNEIDLDHDLMKYEILPEFIGKISIELIEKDGFNPSDFTDGRVIKNGASRVKGKGREMNMVISKNRRRSHNFNSLGLNDFKHG